MSSDTVKIINFPHKIPDCFVQCPGILFLGYSMYAEQSTNFPLDEMSAHQKVILHL